MAGWGIRSATIGAGEIATHEHAKWKQVEFTGVVVRPCGRTASAQQAHQVDDKLLLNAGKTGDEWLMAAGNYSQTRYSPLKQIDASNASRLGLAWYYDTGSLPGTLEASPVISNGTLYGTVTWGVVFAVDARTGKEKWRWDPQLGHQNFPPGSMGKPDSEKVRTGPSLCCGPGNRGVAVYGGKVYVGTLDSHGSSRSMRKPAK